MGKSIIKILFLFVFSIQLVAQNTVHLCVGETHNFAIPYTSGSVYSWEVQNSSIATIISGAGSENVTLNLNSSGIFKLIVEVLNANGCLGYDSVLVEIHKNPTPFISALGPVLICEGVDLTIQTNSIYDSYLWSDGSIFSEILVDTSGNYSVIVTDEFGCKNESNSILIDVQSNFSANFDYEGICINNPTTFFNTSLSVSGMFNSLIWDFGNGFQSYEDSVTYLFDQIGDYQVSLLIETASGCRDSIIKTINVLGKPIANFKYNPYSISTLNSEINFENTSIDGTPYLWDFGDSTYSVIESPSHIYNNAGVYDVKLIVKDVNECVDSITKPIIMYYDFVLHVPTSFTPNNDGDNDQFGPQGLRMNKYKSYSFYIYNKWGEEIFETKDINRFWDGNDNQSGLYTWAIIIVDEIGALHKKVGNVLLIK
jgi:gliding motility-associated-like protein